MYGIFLTFLYVKVGPSTFEKSAYAEPYQVHVPPSVHDEKGPLSSHATSQHKPVHDASTNSYEQNARAAARNASGNHSTTSGMPNVEVRSSGILLNEVVKDEFPGFCSVYYIDIWDSFSQEMEVKK